MSSRHLRIYYIDAYGHEIDRGSICSAVMPLYKVPIHRLPAKRYAGPSHVHRRELAATMMLSERRRIEQRRKGKEAFEYSAVIIIACPAREKAAYRSKRNRTPGLSSALVPTNAYLASFAVLSPKGVVAGDVMLDTLQRTFRAALGRVRDVLMRQPGQQPKGVSA